MPNRLNLSEYWTLVGMHAEDGNTKGVTNVYDAMASDIFGMKRVYTCTADYADPILIKFDGREVPKCVCLTYYTHDMRRGMRAICSFDYIDPRELEKRIEKGKQMSMDMSIQQSAAMNGGHLPEAAKQMILEQIEQRFEGIKQNYKPTLETCLIFMGSWAPGFKNDELILPVVGDKERESIGNFVGCGRAISDTHNKIIYGSGDPLAFMLNTLFEDGKNELSRSSES